jgi:hypothetical protein
MGYDATAYAILGLWVHPEKLHDYLYTRQTVRVCSHATDEKAKFCATCGKPIWKEANVPNEGFDEYDQNLHGFKLLDHGEGAKLEYVAVKYIKHGSYDRNGGMFNLDEIQKGYELMKSKFEGTPIWNKANFGVHVMLHESC